MLALDPLVKNLAIFSESELHDILYCGNYRRIRTRFRDNPCELATSSGTISENVKGVPDHVCVYVEGFERSANLRLNILVFKLNNRVGTE